MDLDEHIRLIFERSEFLEALIDGPLRPARVVDRTGASRSTVNRALSELESAGLVAREDGGYAATPAGRIALEQYRDFRAGADDLRAAADVLAPLPVDSAVGPAVVDGCEAYRGAVPSPYEPAERLYETVASADRYRAALIGLDDPRHLRLCYERVLRDDLPVELVVGPELKETLAESFPRRLAAMAEADGFTLRVGDPPPFGLVLTEADGETTVSVVVFGDGGVHGLLQNDGERAVRWAERAYERATASATDATEEFRRSTDGGVAALEASEGDGGLPATLEREGFVRLTPSYFADRPVAEPTTAWRTGLEFPEVRTGYAVERRLTGEDGGDAAAGEGGSEETAAGSDGDRDPPTLTGRVRDHLEAGSNCVVVGPPGSGKSTACRMVACGWYDDGRGPVLYREGGRGRAVESVDDLVAAVDGARGEPLVVVEDAARSDADAVFEAMARAGDGARWLLDARESEWRDRDVGPAGVDDDLAVVSTPPLLGRDCERVAEHVEATVDDAAAIPTEAVTEALGAETDGYAGTPDETFLLLHRLATYADPLGGAELTTLEAEIDGLLEALRAVGDGAADAAAFVNLLNAADVTVLPAHVRLFADELGLDGAAAEETLSVLEGRVFFETDGDAVRTVTETWSVAFLERYLAAADAGAPERVGRAVSALLAVADDERRRGRLVEALSDAGAPTEDVAADPASWGADAVERIYGIARSHPKLVDLFGSGADLAVEPPAAAPATLRVRASLWRGEALLDAARGGEAAAAFERAATRLEALPDDAVDAETRRELRFECRLGRAHASHDRTEYGAAESEAAALLDAAEDAGADRWAARARAELGDVERARGDLDAAAAEFEAAIETFRELGAEADLASTLLSRSRVARLQGELDAAEDAAREALSAWTDRGSRIGEASAHHELGKIVERRGEMDAAERHQARGLELARAAGRPTTEALCLQRLGVLTERAGELEASLDYYERALDRAREVGDDKQIANAVGNAADVYERLGDYEAAEERYRRALELARELGARDHEAVLLVNRATMGHSLDDYEAAAEDARRCLSIAEETGQALLEVVARYVLTTVALASGSVDDAVATAETALSIAEDRGFERRIVSAEAYLAEALRWQGALESAREAAVRARERAGELGDPYLVAKVEGVAARAALDAGDPAAAADAAERAVDAVDPADERDALLALIAHGAALRERGDGEAAAERLDRALELAAEEEGARAEAAARIERGALARERGDGEAAAAAFETALELATGIDHALLAARARLGLGRVARDGGDAGTAVDRLADAADRFADAGAVGWALTAFDALADAAAAAGDGEEAERARTAARELAEAHDVAAAHDHRRAASDGGDGVADP